MRVRIRFAFVVVTAALAGVVPSGAATGNVTITGLRFEPPTITIFEGDTVRWTSQDGRKHTVTSNSSANAQGESFDSSPGNSCPHLLFDNCLTRGQSFSHTFTHDGTFTYRCKIHGSNTSFANCEMCGRVVVRLRAQPSPTQSATVTPTASSTATASGSPSATPTPTPTGTPTSPGPGEVPGEPWTIPVVPIAAASVAVLGLSGILVYRTMLRR